MEYLFDDDNNNNNNNNSPTVDEKTFLQGLSNAGWTTRRSFRSLAKRFIHVMTTQRDFVVLVAGSTATAGTSSNHFHQSYPMQFHALAKPIFDRLGVNLITHNLAHTLASNNYNNNNNNGPTLDFSLGFSSLYGQDIDIVIWDADWKDTTHGSDKDDAQQRQTLLRDQAFFLRQALITGNKAPFLIGTSLELLRDLYFHADADIAILGTGISGIPITTDSDMVQNLPYAVQYLHCLEDTTTTNNNKNNICEQENVKYNTTCWVERNDKVKPFVPQRKHVRDQNTDDDIRTIPGWREHQLKARIFTFFILEVLQDSFSSWLEHSIFDGYPLPGTYWHITSLYENVRAKATSFNETTLDIWCDFNEYMPKRVCTTPLEARTEVTPRFNPEHTSIRSIIRKGTALLPNIQPSMLYSGTDVDNPSMQLPRNVLDVIAIIQNRKRNRNRYLRTTRKNIVYRHKQTTRQQTLQHPEHPNEEKDISNVISTTTSITTTPTTYNHDASDTNRKLGIKPGTGWNIVNELPGTCDGTYSSTCGRDKNSTCLLSGNMNSDGYVVGNSNNGWLVMDLPTKPIHGIILVKMDIRPGNAQDYIGTNKQLGQRNSLPDTVTLDFAVDGNITTWKKKDILGLGQPNKSTFAQLFTLLDDPTYYQSANTDHKKKDCELALRLQNCNDNCFIKITHIYWG